VVNEFLVKSQLKRYDCKPLPVFKLRPCKNRTSQAIYGAIVGRGTKEAHVATNQTMHYRNKLFTIPLNVLFTTGTRFISILINVN
jgi:hypothetical protein